MIGQVTSVKQVRVGTELASDAATDDTTLDLVDLEELDWNGGRLQIGEEKIRYTIDPETEVLTLGTGLANDYDAETPVHIYPSTYERLAYALAPDAEEEFEARVPHGLFDRLPEGPRGEEAAAEAIEVQNEGGEWVVRDVLGLAPANDVGFLDGLQMADGLARVQVDSGVPGWTSDPVLHGLNGVPTSIHVTVNNSLGNGSRRLIPSYGDLDENSFTIGLRRNDDSNIGAGIVHVSWTAFLSTLVTGRIDEDADSDQGVYGAEGGSD